MNLLYTMEDVAVYGYMTPLKVKIIIALALADSVVRDADVLAVCTSNQSILSTLFHAVMGLNNPIVIVDLPCIAHSIPPGSRKPIPQTRRACRRLQRPRDHPPSRLTEVAHTPETRR